MLPQMKVFLHLPANLILQKLECYSTILSTILTFHWVAMPEKPGVKERNSLCIKTLL